jgi:hypothetical protein
MPRQGVGQRGQLGVDQRILDDDQQVDVAATGKVIVEGQGAVHDHPGDGLPERRPAGARKHFWLFSPIRGCLEGLM